MGDDLEMTGPKWHTALAQVLAPVCRIAHVRACMELTCAESGRSRQAGCCFWCDTMGAWYIQTNLSWEACGSPSHMLILRRILTMCIWQPHTHTHSYPKHQGVQGSSGAAKPTWSVKGSSCQRLDLTDVCLLRAYREETRWTTGTAELHSPLL